VHDERVEIVEQTLGRGGEPFLLELVDQRLEALFGVVGVDRVIVVARRASCCMRASRSR
jgi:hypothetical protein